MEVEGYCVKCRQKRAMKNAKEVIMKNGRLAAKGTCPVCGTGMFKFLPKKK
jgi:tartrate dehydratase alpha subunit/fumarate hydratase class I-like protein